ncbi:MAG: NAD(P)/FAD-dependent oxidoreductase [Patescibacteria group bacterium]|jgi:dihydrolipoamide dehydrogenase
MPTSKFEIIIIGSGPAGIAAAEAAHAAGARSIALVESAPRLGGECPNWGCIPTKSLLSSIEGIVAAKHQGRPASELPKIGVDFGSLLKRERRVVDMITGGGRIERVLDSLGAELLRGHAAFVGPNEIEVSGKRYAAEKFVVAVGGISTVPRIPGLIETGYLTVRDILALGKTPRSLAIIGGGPVGCEFAQIFAPLGVAVTIIEFADHILPREDAEIAAIVEQSFRDQKIGLLTSAKIESVGQERDAVVLAVRLRDGSARQVRAEKIFLAAGKKPDLSGLGLETVGVQRDVEDRIKFNDFFQTENPAIYIAGDAAGRLMYTSVAHREGSAAGHNAIKGNVVRVDLSVLPRGTYCHPEVGSVGLTEKEARDQGYDVGVGRAPYSMLSRSLTSGETEGLVKIVADKKTGLILGGHIVGQSASELVHEIALAMYTGLTYQDFSNMIHAFPTFAEGIGVAAGNVD